MPHYFDGCTLPGGLGRGPDDDYESPEEVERCDECGERATCKIGNTPVCAECNLVYAIGEGVRSDYAECEGCD